MLSILRAFAWLRWRMLLNSFERTGSRDMAERFSVAIDKLGPIIAAILFVPSAVALAAGGALAGYALGTDEGRMTFFDLARFGLLMALAFTLIGPLLLPGGDRTNTARMLLLPIPARALYAAQAATSLADPWVLLVIPLLAGIAVGLALAGALVAAVVAVASGVVLAVALAGLSTTIGLLGHVVTRDRRRGEILTLLLVVVLPLIAFLPGLLGGAMSGGEARGAFRLPIWVGQGARAAFAALPTELYATATGQAAKGSLPAIAGPLAGLVAAATGVHVLGYLLFSSLLNAPASTSSRRTGPMNAVWTRQLPLLTPGASAVAAAHVRLALRTPRGRAILLSPLLVFGLFSALMWHGGGAMQFGPFRFNSGLALATFATSAALVSILPIAVNQFAVDRAGLTMVLLSPVSVREYLSGKAAGNALVVAIPAGLVGLVSLVLFPGATPALWLALGLGLVAAFAAVAPLAAMLSAMFPRAVDMNSVSRGSNPHSAANILGLLSFAAAGAPPALLAAVAIAMERPLLLPLLLVAWLAVVLGVTRVLWRAAERLFEKRRENLATLIR